MFDAIEDRFGRLNVVVHTAGINHPIPLIDLDLADFDEIHRVNVRGTFVVNQQAARRVHDGGSIVNISSSMVRVAPPESERLRGVQGRRRRADPHPGEGAARPRHHRQRGRAGSHRDRDVRASTPAEEQEQLAALPPLGRLGRPDDIADVVSFLVGPTGRWVNGQVVYANGGFV